MLILYKFDLVLLWELNQSGLIYYYIKENVLLKIDYISRSFSFQ
ncbi:hypothetical protein MATR_18480 [Marivirga tractuosa]|uniref:Uncharacterized protein n=1 Tax=Marivirga tractuosa (strain ATCC 23168 / DSM 4126 / NBRC 15989 / NCIMB 1408 / VKM B-1430 / H-43) TaxID=643867 RepID=E4TPX2_MARTH|nr:hypothetical protein Ftrac_0525 [Marivirga tractuosa DSM 4126]BDD15023.1 hypothetical protein MATR_18480 [Marivirga tractuosa]